MTGAGDRRRRIALLASIGLLSLLVVPYSAVHLDVARDVFTALRIARGESLPLLGPLLASVFHLGPAWYYALALPLLGGGGWLAAMLFVGAVAALQFPLAYLAGKALHSRAAGLAWALLLLLPTWSFFEWVFPLHTRWTAPAMLAGLLCALRFARGGKRRYAFGVGLAVALALHAHPSSLGLAPLGAVALWVGARRAGRGLAGPLLLATGGGVLPFIPWFVDQGRLGFPLLGAAQDWVASDAGGGSLWPLPAFAWQVLAGGTGYWVEVVMGAGRSAGALAMAAMVLPWLLALPGWRRLLGDPATRGMALAALGGALVIGATVVLLRPQLPFYMTTPLHVALGGVLAIGLAAGIRRALLPALATLALSAHLASVATVATAQVRGEWPAALLPMFHVLAPPAAPVPFALVPAYAMAPLGRWLCSGPVAVHGPLGARLVDDYLLAARLACAAPDVEIGGAANDARPRWIGLPRRMLRALRLDPGLRVGNFGLLPVRAVHGEPSAFRAPAEPVYPPLPPAAAPQPPRTYRIALPAGAHLAATRLGVALLPAPEVEVRHAGTLWAPRVADAHASVYGCADCGAVELEVVVRSHDPARVDLVVF